MIIRTVQVVTRPGQEAAYSEFFHNESLALSRRTEGVLFSLAGVARRDTPREFSFTSVWRDISALHAFVGDDITQPSSNVLGSEYVETRTIKHYDLLSG